jgi:hypothetical protein
LENVYIFYGHLEYFMEILRYFMTVWNILNSFGTFCTNTNLATLDKTTNLCPSPTFLPLLRFYVAFEKKEFFRLRSFLSFVPLPDRYRDSEFVVPSQFHFCCKSSTPFSRPHPRRSGREYRNK